jgi:hypothetical protein
MSSITHAVRARRFFYGPKSSVHYVCRGSLSDCKTYVADQDRGIYYLSHNEYARPVHRIVRLDSLGPLARQQAQWAETYGDALLLRS